MARCPIQQSHRRLARARGGHCSSRTSCLAERSHHNAGPVLFSSARAWRPAARGPELISDLSLFQSDLQVSRLSQNGCSVACLWLKKSRVLSHICCRYCTQPAKMRQILYCLPFRKGPYNSARASTQNPARRIPVALLFRPQATAQAQSNQSCPIARPNCATCTYPVQRCSNEEREHLPGQTPPRFATVSTFSSSFATQHNNTTEHNLQPAAKHPPTARPGSPQYLPASALRLSTVPYLAITSEPNRIPET